MNRMIAARVIALITLSVNIAMANNGDTLKTVRGAIPALTLNDCMLIAIEHNLGLENSRINVQQSEYREDIYKTGLLFPSMNMSARLSEVARPDQDPTFSQSVRAYSNFGVFNMRHAPRKKKYGYDVQLNEFWFKSSTADLQRNIAIAYIDANLVRKQQEILIEQLLELDSLNEISRIIGEDSLNPRPAILRLSDNILPLKEQIRTRLKALETNFEDKLGQLNNLMSLENQHNFRLADELELSGNGIADENAFVDKIIQRAIAIRNEDDELRKLHLQQDMKLVNAAFFPDVSAGVAYEEDFITNFKGFTANVNIYYNVYDPTARKKKDIAKLDVEKINNSILENERNIGRWLRSYYNKSKEHRSQVRISLVESQRNLYQNTLDLFLNATGVSISATDVINTFKDYYNAKTSYYQNIAWSENQKMYIRHQLMDFVTPFEDLDKGYGANRRPEIEER